MQVNTLRNYCIQLNTSLEAPQYLIGRGEGIRFRENNHMVQGKGSYGSRKMVIWFKEKGHMGDISLNLNLIHRIK